MLSRVASDDGSYLPFQPDSRHAAWASAQRGRPAPVCADLRRVMVGRGWSVGCVGSASRESLVLRGARPDAAAFDTRATLARVERQMAALSPRMVISLGDSFHDRRARPRMAADDVARLRRMTEKYLTGSGSRATTIPLRRMILVGGQQSNWPSGPSRFGAYPRLVRRAARSRAICTLAPGLLVAAGGPCGRAALRQTASVWSCRLMVR